MMGCVRLCILEAVEGGLFADVLEVIHCALLHMLEDVEDVLCFLEILEVPQ